MPFDALSPAQRADALARMDAELFDVVVIGGGVTGAGVALDAATRGLSVAVVEQRDLAAGTSSRSSKLVHGGLRYLEQLDFGLVREALQERGLMLDRLAPHLVKPVSFVYPLTHRVWERAYVAAGVTLYDTMGGARQLPADVRFAAKSEAITALLSQAGLGAAGGSAGQAMAPQDLMRLAEGMTVLVSCWD